MRLASVTIRGCVVVLSLLCIGNSRHGLAQRNSQPPLFEFHSGFWINLHHFLYREAAQSVSGHGPRNPPLTKADSEELEQLSPAERTAWNEALTYYSRKIVNRDLLFDGELIQTKEKLEDAESSPDLAKVDISEALKPALLEAAPIYRRHWWPRHDAQNRKWIASLEPLITRFGPALSTELSRIYDEPWPNYPVRVDAVAYANWAGAYTTVEPTRPTISTADPANQGTAALEIVFHETSHGMMGKVMEAMNAAETSLNAHRSGAAFHSGSIWHAVLFYTAGELVAEQIAGYTPYADKNGLWVRAWPAPDRSLIEQDWMPHIKGSATLPQSLEKLVGDLASAVPSS